MTALLKLSGVSRSFGAIQALKAVDFEIGAGEIMGLVGENGAGKSTLVKIISGFDDGYTGDFSLNGESQRFSSPLKAERAGVAIAQQELSLIPAMSVAENVFISGEHAPIFATQSSFARTASPFLKEVGLEDVDPYIPVERLSVGEQQLVEVARLLAQQPQILILDEPTAALDSHRGQQVMESFAQVAHEQNAGVIVVTHDRRA